MVSDEPPVRIGLRVPDVTGAATLYEHFGFVPFATVPGPDGRVLLAVLRRGPLQLLVDALDGLPFPDSARERLTRGAPRGLGVVIGLAVDDVDDAARRAGALGCELTAGPLEAPWGERYAELLDPYGYAWKFFRVADQVPDDGTAATVREWFGPR